MKRLDKLIKIISLLLLTLLICLGINNIYSQQKILSEYLNDLKRDIKTEYKMRLRDVVDTTISFIKTSEIEIEEKYFKLLTKEAINIKKINSSKNDLDTYHHDFIVLSKKNEENRLSKKIMINNQIYFLSVKNSEITKQLEIKTRRFLYQNTKDNGQYLWISKIIDYEGGDNYAKRLIHPNLKATEGTLLSTKIEDIEGNLPYLEELKGINNKQEVYFEYFFKTMNTNEISKKLSYSKLYLKENWIVSTGIPLDNFDTDMQKRSKVFKEKYYDYILRQATIGILCILLCIILVKYMYNKIHKFFDLNKNLRKKLKKELLTSEKKVNKYFNLSANLNMIMNHKGIVYEVNDGFCEMLGYDKKEILNSSFLDLIHPQDMTKTLKEMKNMHKRESICYFVNRYKHKNGTYRYLAWSANPDAKKEFIYASAQDITDSKTKDSLLNQQSKMAAMGEMIANIAHQWKQPLSAITSISSSIQIKYENNMLDEKEIPLSMENIENSANYLAHTIDDFRDFFKEDKEKNITTVQKIVEKTLKLTSTLYKKNQIEIIKDIEYLKFLILENELIQVLINLLSNAKDAFVKENSRKLIFINAYKIKDEKIIIEVKDNAGGISNEVIAKVFDAYFTTKDETKGTGIGLYMSKEIITKNLQGQISVTNETFEYENITYEGAKFQITLPYKER